MLPSPQEHTLSKRTVLGKNWALIGDAAAWVDPLTGEGLFYAIRRGNCWGEALAEGCPEKYPVWIRASFSAELEFASRIVQRFYRGSVLGTAVTTRMVQLMRKSPVLRQLVGDLFSGSQDYTSLKKRLWGHLGITVSEFISNVLNLESPIAAPAVSRGGGRGLSGILVSLFLIDFCVLQQTLSFFRYNRGHMPGHLKTRGAERPPRWPPKKTPAPFPKLKKKNAWKNLPHVWELIKPRRGILLLGLGLMAVNRVSGLILPASTKYLVDDVIGKHHIALLTPIVLAVLGATVVQGLTSFT